MCSSLLSRMGCFAWNVVALSSLVVTGGRATGQAAERSEGIAYKVAILGCPVKPDVPWTRQSLLELKRLGFNAVQLNIAWGYRPGDEPLNLEDVVDLPAEHRERLANTVAPRSDSSPHRVKQRRAELHQRIRLSQEAGMRTIFHFGAPYNGAHTEDAPPNCLLDGTTSERYVRLLEAFAAEYPGVDDILIYMYDQNAWLCSEFGPCPRCLGIPLHDRVVPFLNRLATIWHKTQPAGRLWWEPWELSSGQVLQSIQELDPKMVGLALHCNIAEVMATMPVDRWLENSCRLASSRGIPVIVEYFLGGASEEVVPYVHLSHPLVTLRGLKKIAAIPKVAGIKEYFGLLPNREDPNLRMTGLFFERPNITEADALRKLAEPYGDAADDMIRFWRLTSQGMELFPWNASWMFRRIGKSNPVHSLSAAFVRGVPWHTPSWVSTRRGIFMKTDGSEPDAWMLEDVQLRCELSAVRLRAAEQLGLKIHGKIPSTLADGFRRNLEELHQMSRRVMAYAYHCRETNLAAMMRRVRNSGREVPERLTREMLTVLKEDRANQRPGQPIDAALELFERNIDAFLAKYFLVTPDGVSKGHHSATSR